MQSKSQHFWTQKNLFQYYTDLHSGQQKIILQVATPIAQRILEEYYEYG